MTVHAGRHHNLLGLGVIAPRSERRPDLHPQLGCGRRVKKGQKRRVQQQARGTGEDFGRSVEFDTEDGVADGLQVHAQLVRATGFRATRPSTAWCIR